MSVHYHPGIGSPYARSVPAPWSPPPTSPDDEVTVVTPPRARQFRTPPPAPGAWPPPGPYYPPVGWAPAPYPAPNQRRTSRTWAIAAAATAATLLVGGTALALSVGGSNQSTSSDPSTAGLVPAGPSVAATAPPVPTTTTKAPVVPADALPGLLPDPTAINAIVGSSAMTVAKTTENHMDDPKSDTPECLGAYHPVEHAAYRGSGWKAMQGQLLRDGDDFQHVVIQTVVSFPTAKAASDFVAGQHGSWRKCLGQSVTADYKDGAESFSVNSVDLKGGVLRAQLTQQGGQGWRCQHALTSRNNVVADVNACGFAPGEQAAAIATRITNLATA